MSEMNVEQARFNMIEQQIRPWDVLDQRVLDTLAAVPREEFVPERYRDLAFSDLNLPLDHGQVMMSPKLEGRLLQALDVQPSDSVLEVGTGSGYLSACLGRLAGSVLSVDLFEDFKFAAQKKAAAAGIDNVSYRVADAAAGWDPNSRFDCIAVTGSLPVLHRGFHDALAVGGRLFVIVGKPPVMEALLITRVGPNDWSRESLFETSMPALLHAEQPQAFVF